MANTVQLNLTVKDDGSVVLDKFVDTAKKGAQEVAKSATVTGKSLEEMGGYATSAGVALAAFGASGVLAFRGALEAARAFEDQMGAVSTLLIGNTSVSIETIRSDLLALDDRLGSSAALTNALYQALSSGVDAGKGVEFVGEAAKLASAGLGDLTGTVDLLTTVLNAYGLEADQSSQVSEALFEAVKVGKTTIEELSGSMGRVIPTAKNLGVGINDLSAVVAKLTTVGLSTDTAVTSLNAALVAMQSPGSDAEKVAKALGFSFDDLRRVIRDQGLVAGLELLEEKTGGNAQAIAKLIPSVEAQRAVFALLGGDVDQLNGFLADFTREASAGGQVASAFEERAKTLDGAMKALAVSTEKAKINLATGLNVAFIDTAESARHILDQFNDLSGESQAFVAQIGAVATGLTAAGGASLLLLGRLPDIIAGFKALNGIIPITVGATSAWGLSAAGAVTGLTAVGAAAVLLGSKIADLTIDINEARAQNENLLESFQKLPPAMRAAQAASGGVAIELGKQREALAGVEEEMSVLRIQIENGNKATTASGESMSDLEAKAAALRERIASLNGTLGKATDDLVAAGRAGAEAGKGAKAAGDAAGGATVDLSKLDEEADKTAQTLATLAEQSAQFAAAQLDQAAATGDLIRTQEAYQTALDKAAEAYQANLAVATAAAEAGKSEAEVTALRAKAENDFATAANAAADKVSAAYQREQESQEALAGTLADLQVAHDLEALASANAEQAGAVYAKTVEDIEAANRQAIDAIEAKRGVTLNDAEAEKAVAEANEKTRQQLAAAEQQYRDTAAAADSYGQILDEVANTLADRALDLGFALLTGQASWKDAGKQLASIFGETAIDVIKEILKPGLVDFFKSLAQPLMSALGSALSGGASFLASGLDSLFGTTLASVGTSAATEAGAEAAGVAVGEGVLGGLGAALTAAAPYVAAVAAAGGVLYATITTSEMGPEAKAGIIAALAGTAGGPLGWLGAGLLYAFGVLDGPDMRKRIALEVERIITTALREDADYQQALEAGLAPLGIALTPALIKTIGGASRQNDLLRAQAEELAAEYGAEFMAGFSPAFTESINKHGASSTSVPVSDWIRAFFPDADAATQAYAQELAKSLASVEVASMGLTGSDALVATEQLAAGYVNLAQAQGLSVDEFVHMLEVQNQAAGMSTQFLASLDALNAGLTTQQGSLEQVASAMSKAFGVPVEASNLTDMFIQVAGATGDAKQAAATFTTQLQRMAAEDPAIQALVDSLDPPLTEALQNVEDGAAGAAAAFRDLVGTVAADLTNVVDAANLLIGSVSFSGLNDQLATLQDQLANTDDAAVAENLKAQIASVEAQIESLSPKVDVINDQIQGSLQSLVSAAEQDGQLTIDEFSSMLAELEILATLPAGTVSESTSALVDQIIAQFQVALKLTDQQVADLRAQIEAGGPIVPPVVTTPPVDQAAIDAAAAGTAAVAGNSQDAAAAQQALATAATEVATAVGASGDEFTALAQAAGLSSEQVRAALAGVIGTAEDGQGLTAMNQLLANVIPVSLDTLTGGILGATGAWHDNVDYARGAVVMLADEINAVPTDKTITFHIVQDGKVPTTGDTGGDGHAAGHWKVPGPVGQPYATILHGGERVLSVEEDREYQRLRFGAADAAEATAAPAVYAAPASSGSARGTSARSVANEVIRSLTDSGRLHVLAVQTADLGALTEQVGREVALNIVPRLSSAGYLKADPRTGVIGRAASMPGRR